MVPSRALRSITVSLALIGLGGLLGCGSDSSSTLKTQNPAGPSPDLIFAEGWNEVAITANWAKTRLDHVAHFMTTRNACGRDAGGVITLDPWNRLARGLNAYVKMQPLKEPKCFPVELRAKMDGTAELITPSGKRQLIEVKGNEFCSYIPDAQVSREVFEVLDHVVQTADREECPNGWGSG